MTKLSMGKRTYDQYCPAARALDVVGERWTLLLVRDLMLGPRRYTDLLDGLPGLGPNVLAERLRGLEEQGIVRRAKLPPPAASTVYELTEQGAGLSEVVLALAKWGHRFMDMPAVGDSVNVGWMLLYLQSIADREAARGVSEVYEFRIDEEVFHLIVEDGSVEAVQGPAPGGAAVVVESDLASFAAVGSGRLDPYEARDRGLTRVAGDEQAIERSLRIMVLGRTGDQAPG